MSLTVKIAIGLALLLTLIIGVIDVLYQSKLRNLRVCCGTIGFGLYLLVLIVGNVATTLVGHSLIEAYTAPPQSETVAKETSAKSADPPRVAAAVFAAAPWFWSAFLGVFAFEAILQRINVTFFDKGVLTISDWISKARDGAVAAAVAGHAGMLVQREQRLAAKIAGPAGPSDIDLNTYVQNWLGPTRVQELEQLAAANHANPRLAKALALAAGAYDRASTLV